MTPASGLSPAALEELLRSHSRLPGHLRDNFETWLKDPGTLERFLTLVPGPRSSETTLVDIGCYQPSVGFYFKLGWRSVIGLFVDEGEATVTESYEDATGASARFIRSDVESARLPIGDATVDVVLMLQVWEHFAIDPMHALWEVNRVLKPGGRVVLSTPNGASWQYALRIFRGQAAWAGMEFTGFSHNRHNRLYDCTELKTILEQAGFHVGRCATADFGLGVTHWSSAGFRAALRVIDTFSRVWSTRPRERGATLFVEATKAGAPKERFPEILYLTERDWPGITQERDRALRRGLAP
jgi:SAM-dependent methyltransferase